MDAIETNYLKERFPMAFERPEGDPQNGNQKKKPCNIKRHHARPKWTPDLLEGGGTQNEKADPNAPNDFCLWRQSGLGKGKIQWSFEP